MSKDMGLIAGLAAELQVPVAALELAAATFERAIAAGYGNYDFSVVAALQAEAAGTELPGGQAAVGR
jgi:3-hydroxyisobutyrate dehydrogenase-like beta-hydroxyacid dehydrogenase